MPIRFLLGLPMLMAAAGDGGGSGGGGAAGEALEVDIDGLKVSLPKAQAEQLIAKRQAAKEERRQLDIRLGALEAEKRAAEEKAERERQDAERAKLTSKGEYDKALELEKKTHAEKIGKLADKYRDAELRRQILANPKVAEVKDPAARDELVALFISQLKPGCRFNVDAERLEASTDGGVPPVDKDGKALSAEAWIAQRLDASPLLRPAASPGSGAAGGGNPPAGLKVITRKQYEASVRGEDDETSAIVKAGKYRVVDG